MGVPFFHNYLLAGSIAGWAAAQIIKVVLYAIATKKFSMERLVGAGGMPSSHAATVCALATTAAVQFGFASNEFSISAVLACIVMYDACGIRRAVGEHARSLNELRRMIINDMPAERKFIELIGHTPLQVLVGSVIGIMTAMIMQSIF